ncbi:acetyltransferase-like isoleucine patch superfamily enzyme [Pedobacter africanus]|uniref:Acetyltransferase-like isoleucine patch superfamily enzyme n=1 Tax=Pedobacter africanus TaxID=151894 RepID=A0ACC6KTQ0_9SPHI|nr:acyltransferase [Pedobacter africanus]MDR6782493.1 acetyltransferase-like isoleucine patch superfamily enzyme [Pedobacter africanus]
MSVVDKIKKNHKLKKIAHWLLIPSNDHRPRLWVRIFVNPFLHKRGRRSIIRWNSRMDVFPFNRFVLGKGSIIEDFVTVNNGMGNVLIGDHSIIGIGSVLIGPVTVGNDVMLAQNIVVSGLNHGYEDPDIAPSLQKDTVKQIVISDEVWIGANSVITAGITIGRHAVVGAGSVVTKDVPEYSVVVGNPARVVKQYSFEEKAWKKV